MTDTTTNEVALLKRAFHRIMQELPRTAAADDDERCYREHEPALLETVTLHRSVFQSVATAAREAEEERPAAWRAQLERVVDRFPNASQQLRPLLAAIRGAIACLPSAPYGMPSLKELKPLVELLVRARLPLRRIEPLFCPPARITAPRVPILASLDTKGVFTGAESGPHTGRANLTHGEKIIDELRTQLKEKGYEELTE